MLKICASKKSYGVDKNIYDSIIKIKMNTYWRRFFFASICRGSKTNSMLELFFVI